LYARVSTTEQAEEGYSIDAQLEAMRRYCRAEGWEVEAVYTDPGISGTTGDRPGLQAALADCETGGIDALLTHRLDRFYRNLRLQLETMERLERWGIAYVSVSENLDFSSPHGKLVASMMGSVNQYFIDNLKRETTKGKKARAGQGLSNASTTPHGYKRTEQGLDQANPEAAKAVILAFESYATGRHSDTDIAGILNRAGHPPSRRARSGKWTREGVRYLLNNPFYAGLVRHGDDLYPGQHEPLVSKELFDEVRVIRARRNNNRGGRRRSDRVYLLAGIAACSRCGLNLVSQTSDRPGRKPIAQYYCPSRRRYIPCAAPTKLTRADVVDEQIGDLIAQLRLPDDWRERLAELAQHREEKGNIEGKRRYLRGKLRRLREVYIDGHLGRGEYTRRRAELEVELDALREPEAPEVEEAGATLESLADAWEGAPVRLRAEILRAIFESVIVDVAARRLVCVKPYPPFVPLFRMDGLIEKEGCFYVDEEEGQEAGSED
jgi:site-specific DNA recombinase